MPSSGSSQSARLSAIGLASALAIGCSGDDGTRATATFGTGSASASASASATDTDTSTATDSATDGPSTSGPSSMTDPDSSGTDPASSGTDPDSSGTDPDSSGTDPASSGTDPSATETDTAGSSSDGGPVCGDGVIDAGEDCEGDDLGGADCVTQGFDQGVLACDACAFDTTACVTLTCGDGMIDGKEVCDGDDLGGATCISEGFLGGALACLDNCGEFDTGACFAAMCGNGVVEGAEVCDGADLDGATCVSEGHDGGQLACAGNCMGYDANACTDCGDGVIEGTELCDGAQVGGATCVGQGFDGGSLTCNAACNGYDVVNCTECGDGVQEGAEPCDGGDLGGDSCASFGLLDGTLGCAANCQFDTGGCGVLFGSDTGYDGYEFHGAPLPCDNIAGTGTPTGLTDDSVLQVGIGFTFPLYGANFNQVAIESNGTLHFGDATYQTYTNACLPTVTAPNTHNIYVFWDDLNPSTGASEVYYQTIGMVGDRRMVVQWDTAHFGGDANDLIRVQAVLYEATGQVAVCYPDTLSAADIGNNGAEATSGIQQDSMSGFDYSCNAATLTNGTELRYVPI